MIYNESQFIVGGYRSIKTFKCYLMKVEPTTQNDINTNMKIRIIKNILKQGSNKNQYIRINCTEYVLLILLMYPKAMVDKFSQEIYEYLKLAI